jgi:SAM-dependent methyltransferase
LKRAFIPPVKRLGEPLVSGIDIYGERNIEWSFLSVEMPDGPGEALEFGCEQGYLSLLAAQKGFHVIANDLQQQRFTWHHSSVDFQQGDLLTLELPSHHFDLIINCSSVEHVGVAGRYGIEKESWDGDLMVMGRLADLLKPGGYLLMTVPCGRDAVMAPWCRVYGRERLPRLLDALQVIKERYWVKNASNRWVACDRESALNFEPQFDAKDGHRCAYALGGFVLAKR